ncbi:hypothetical protein [Halobacillus campisalis]
MGEAVVSILIKVRNGQVVYLSRYDNDLEQALADADLTFENKL